MLDIFKKKQACCRYQHRLANLETTSHTPKEQWCVDYNGCMREGKCIVKALDTKKKEEEEISKKLFF